MEDFPIADLETMMEEYLNGLDNVTETDWLATDREFAKTEISEFLKWLASKK